MALEVKLNTRMRKLRINLPDDFPEDQRKVVEIECRYSIGKAMAYANGIGLGKFKEVVKEGLDIVDENDDDFDFRGDWQAYHLEVSGGFITPEEWATAYYGDDWQGNLVKLGELSVGDYFTMDDQTCQVIHVKYKTNDIRFYDTGTYTTHIKSPDTMVERAYFKLVSISQEEAIEPKIKKQDDSVRVSKMLSSIEGGKDFIKNEKRYKVVPRNSNFYPNVDEGEILVICIDDGRLDLWVNFELVYPVDE